MALCKDCIHYNVCEQWAMDMFDEWGVDAMPNACDLFKSAADVAPKNEVAREIIAEIAPHCAGKVCHNLDFTMGYLAAMNKVLAELAKIKRKYTEEK